MIPRFWAAALLLASTIVAAAPAPAASAPAHRIVALVPSLTEDLAALGVLDRVVGVSDFSDYPPAAKRIPIVGSFSSVATEQILALHPDLVVGITAQRRATEDLRRAGVDVVLVQDDDFASIFANLHLLGALVGRAPQADALIARLRARTAALVRSVPRRTHQPRAFVVLGVDPIFTVGSGSYIATLLTMAGGRDATNVRTPYASSSAEALLADQPDVLIVDGAVGFAAVRDRTPWRELHAVRDGHVATLRDAALLERPGPRYNEGLAWLIDVLRSVRTS
ncbi:MAG: helical backbone metal receptor [Vulcanimicrobiaceae bacterium]